MGGATATGPSGASAPGESGWRRGRWGGSAGRDHFAAFVVREQGQVGAAAGYRAWPSRTAHIGVLTAPAVRGQRPARVTDSATVAHALTARLLPQWRARPRASRRVAALSGFEELGFQLSIEII
ncbi:GNAT family N-acetyltransferase [Streptomyces sp. NPDC051742]|uniref:GNAT family N-acetyltransferase n=1 Tax=unclassified Streptomyces TaxID=2593676 RepID=UPI003434CCB9